MAIFNQIEFFTYIDILPGVKFSFQPQSLLLAKGEKKCHSLDRVESKLARAQIQSHNWPEAQSPREKGIQIQNAVLTHSCVLELDAHVTSCCCRCYIENITSDLSLLGICLLNMSRTLLFLPRYCEALHFLAFVPFK